MESSFDFYKMLIGGNYKLVSNMICPWSPGHMTAELDNALRMIYLKEVPEDATCILPLAEHVVTKTIHDLYASSLLPRLNYLPNNALFLWAREIAAACPNMVVDPAIGHIRFAIRNLADYGDFRLMPVQGLLHRFFTNKVAVGAEVAWRRRRSQSMEYQPLRNVPPPGDDLLEFLGGRCDKLALVHIRTSLDANIATWTPPSQFYPSLEYLRDTGHTIVFVSREKYPEEFARFGVLNYAQSPVASFRNDLLLFKAAKCAIVSGAGIGALAQIMDTPLVWANSWGLSIPFSTKACVWLPVRITEKQSGRLLSFSEQLALFHDRPPAWEIPPGPNNPYYGNTWSLNDRADLDARAPDAEEMLYAVQECVSLSQNWVPRSGLQNEFSALRPHDSGLPYMEARISQHFIEKHQDGLL